MSASGKGFLLLSSSSSNTLRLSSHRLAYLLPTAVFLIAPIVLFIGNKYYIKVPPRGSVVLETFRVSRVAMRGFWKSPKAYIRTARGEGVWQRAKPSYVMTQSSEVAKGESAAAAKPSWITWDDQFVDEVKRTFLAWSDALVEYLCCSLCH
jgi:POT family proton-dependent oligopeptide transporter